jgi:hypothetical protein
MASKTHNHGEPMRFTLVALLIAGPALAQEDEETPAEEAPAEEAPAEEAPAEEAPAEEAPAEEAPAEEAPAAPASPQIPVEVALQNGMTLQGTASQMDILNWSAGTPLSFTPTGGAATVLPGDKIVAIGQPGQVEVAVEKAEAKKPESTYTSPKGFSVPNPAASRYLYAPSSINMKAGQGYVSQKLVFTSVAYAPTDNVTVIFGTFTPFPPLMTVFGGKAGFKINDNLHVSFGGEAFVMGIEQEVPMALAFGAATWGNEDSHITLASGIAGGSLTDSLGIPVMLGGQWRMGEGTAFVTENWAIFNSADLTNGNASGSLVAFIGSAAVRLVGRRDGPGGMQRGMRTASGHPKTTWDLGLIVLSGRNIDSITNAGTGESESTSFATWDGFGPMPWIDWTWHFGAKGG